MQVRSQEFKARAARSLSDPHLAKALANLRQRMVLGRIASVAELDNFEQAREAAKRVRDDALQHLDLLLEQFERNATARGTRVHWAETPQDMNRIVLDIAQRAGVRKAIKSKSMLGEESGLNAYLAAAGIEVRE
ncbi:MAG TPA: LUD domain-containing protein, partial [Burkholderiales bacterium]|nr:LUD domain-containing protein [Burkholderiales bacterium]